MTLTQAAELVAVTAALAVVPTVASAQTNVLTNRYDNARTGANLGETTLTVVNVNVNQFGKLYSYPVDGAVVAEPLYAAGMMINGTPRNMLFVVTMNDKAYAFDADVNALIWMRDFTNPPTVTYGSLADVEPPTGSDLPNLGIEGTPVIDPATGTMYLVALTKESGTYVQRLHALDISTGQDRIGSPVAISAAVPGTSADAVNGLVPFDPLYENQRAALALTNGVVLIAWASHDDITPYHGWVMGYNAATLAQVGVFCTTPDNYYGGIWQSGRAPAIDAAGNAYYQTGNGIWDGARNFGDSILKFSVSPSGLSLVDWFTPADYAYLNGGDVDLGATGPTLLPNTNILIGGGKESVFYLVNTNSMGHEAANDTQIIQEFAVNGGEFLGGPAYWNSATAGPLVYNWPEEDLLKAYRFNGTKLDTPAVAQGNVVSPGHPGAALTVSANGGAAGTGIVWASLPTNQNSDIGFVAGIVRAYDAETLQEIWNSEQNPTRDRLGRFLKFVPPVETNGRVYMPTFDDAVVVYGLLPVTPDFTIDAGPAIQTTPTIGTTTYTVTVGAVNGFTGAVTLSAAGLPNGATAAFAPSTVTGAGTSTLTITTTGAALGTSSLTITGSSGAVAHATSVTLSVTASALTIDVTAPTDQQTASPTVTSPTFSTHAANELVLAFITTDFVSGTNTTVRSVSGGGLTFTLVVRANGRSGTSEIWRALAPAALTNVSVTATLSQSTASSMTIVTFMGVDASGTNGSGAIGATASKSAATGAPTASLVTTRNNSWVFGVGNDYDNAVARVPGAGQSLVHQTLASVGDTYWVQSQNNPTALAGTSVAINDTAPSTDQYNLALAEILPAPGPAGPPDLTIATSHSGNFTQGQSGATYTITVTNGGASATSVTVTVVDTLPSGLTQPAMSGNGWSCPPTTLTCTRSDALAAGASYPPITLSVNVASDAPSPITNTANVSGGGETDTGNDSVNDVTTIVPPPDLTVTKSHTGDFTAGQTGATYAIAVKNAGLGPTTGTTTVTDTLPTGLTTTAIAGTGWSCTLTTLTCSRSDVLAAGASYPPITVTVNVATIAGATVTNIATVSGGGELNTTNDTSSDATNVIHAPDLAIAKSHSGNFTQGQVGAGYTIAVTNIGSASTQGTVTVTDVLPAGLTATTIAGTDWNCTLGTLTCTRADALAAGSAYPIVVLTVNVAANAAPSITNTATVSGAGDVNASNDSASDATTVLSHAITIDKTVSIDQLSSSTRIVSPAFSTALANELLLAFVSTDQVSNTNITVTGVTGGALTWVLVVRTNAQKGTSEIWRAFAAPALANVSVTATLSQSVASSLTVMTFSGVDTTGTNGSGAIGAIVSRSGATGAPTASLVTTRGNSWVFGVGNDYDKAVTRVPGAGQSLVHQTLASVGDTYWVQKQNTPTASAGTTVTINDTSPTGDRYNLSLCEILPGS